MITCKDVFEAMGRKYYLHHSREKFILIGDEIDKRIINNIERGLEFQKKLYNRDYNITTINTTKPFKPSKKFKNGSVRFLFLDYPKDLKFFNDALKFWGEKICYFGAILFRGNYEDEELKYHTIDERYVGSLHGIYRTEPSLTIIYKKWGMRYDK